MTAIVTVTPTNSAAPSASSTASSDSSGGPGGSGGGLSPGSIIGLSVAGGVALIGIVGFVVWKLTRKRFSDFDDSKITHYFIVLSVPTRENF